MIIAAGEFKKHCLKLMDQVQTGRQSILITKRGKPVAKLVPVDDPTAVPLFGCMKGRLHEAGDVVKPTGEAWHADA
ncbi:MAG TPA: type II toxin-antitoxin system Phd/YefM family antitoxin [Kiritimatiellia bacterium]|nr:type II toxin-antitoxin system Phd/YefM family antitoxin [Kiritimatiellia bacterium]